MGQNRQIIPLTEVPKHRPWTTVRYLRRLVYERRIPYHKLGPGQRSPVFIDLADLDDFMEKSRVEAAR